MRKAAELKELRFRPHHFLCTLCHRGKGYSPSFIRSYAKLMKRLGKPDTGDEEPIQVVSGPDMICDFCPKLHGEACETQDVVEALDRAHAGILGLEEGQVITWGEAKRLLAEHMTPRAFDEACKPCGWKPRGLCEKVLQELREERKAS